MLTPRLSRPGPPLTGNVSAGRPTPLPAVGLFPTGTAAAVGIPKGPVTGSPSPSPAVVASAVPGRHAERVPGFQTTKRVIAQRYGTVAAINGDFAFWTGRPMHPFIEDGYLRYTSGTHGQNFAVSRDEVHRFMNRPKVTAGLAIPAAKTTLPVAHVNDGDGRKSDVVEYTPVFQSHGAKNSCTARLFKQLGAVEAMNLDGGGSATMVVKGRIVNRPSDNVERPITSAVLVLPGRDSGEPRIANDAPRQTADVTEAAAAVSDPGSTGGLLDDLSTGTPEDADGAS